MDTTRLKLDDMDQRHRALTAPIAAAFKEAAVVCLSRHHQSPLELVLFNNGAEMPGEITWSPPTPRALSAWANEIDATEQGAYACVIAGVEAIRGLFAVRRAETLTGADYYVGPAEAGVTDLEGCLRLEISGVGRGDRANVNKRLSQKIRQAKDGKSSLPALAGLFGFYARLLMLSDVPDAS